MNRTRSRGGDAALIHFLVRQGIVSEEVIRRSEQSVVDDDDKTLLDVLVLDGLVDEEVLAQVLADQQRLELVNPASYAIDPSVVSLLKEEVATRYHVVPLRVEEGVLTIATANPLDREALRAIEFATGKRVRAEVSTLTAVRDAVRHAYHMEESLDAYLQGFEATGDTAIVPLDETDGDLGSLAASDLPPIIKLLNLILLEGIRLGASDVHIEPAPAVVQVRYRIDGLLEEASRLPKWISAPLIARCKVMARLDITERRVPQDGRIGIRYRNSKIDLRVSSLPMQHGEKITMRILDPASARGGLDKLHMLERDSVCVRRALTRPEGIVLVTGPTGSGKSTTLYAMINDIASSARNIVTIENPVEYLVPGVNQVDVNEKQGLTFATTLRSILRQDPDVILVGEIRDGETAEVALRAAHTGHLVLSTLHTNDTVATIARLFDLGIEPYMLASGLHLVLAQRLVRKVCAECAESYEPSESERRQLGLPKEGSFRRSRGCTECRNTGYSGRRAILEVLEVTPQLSKLIESRAPESSLRQQARADGTVTLAVRATELVAQGITTVEEALRVVDTVIEHTLCPHCQAPIESGFKVCPLCLAPLRLECTKCNQPLQQSWKVCPFCLTPAPSVAAVYAPVEQSAALVREISSPVTTVEPEAGSAQKPYTALVVDDAADIRRLITVSLEHSDLNLRVVTAENGSEALEKALQELPDVIVLDVMMPEMDGFEVCRQLRANVRTAFVPILMLTALDDLAHREKGFLAGTDDYIAKPFNREDLVSRVRRVLCRNYGLATEELATAPSRAAASLA